MAGGLLQKLQAGRSDVDRRLRGSVREALKATGYTSLQGVHITVESRRVRLQGRVPSYYLKQMAQTAAMSARDVESLRNEIEVH